MLKDHHIICVASTAWETNYQQAIVQHISLLAKDNTVLFVDYPFTWLDALRGILKGEKVSTYRFFGFNDRMRKVSTAFNTELYLLSLPPVLPINWIDNEKLFDLLNLINYRIIIRAIKKAIKKLEIKAPVYINSWNPVFGINYHDEFSETLQAYYCYDEMSASKWIKKHGARLEKRYLSIPDVVVTTSKELSNNKSKINHNCFVIPNGVNFSVYNEYLNSKSNDEIIEKRGYKHVIGYIGTIDDRMDIPLLQNTIGQLSDYLFVFIGRITDPHIKSSIEEFSNVIFVPPLDIHELPKYVNEFSACIIPFAKNEFTINVYPMKINEYLAMGKPVVLTDFSDLKEFESICTIVSSPADFANALVNEINSDSLIKINQRISTAAQNSWEKRANAFSEILEQQLNAKKDRGLI